MAITTEQIIESLYALATRMLNDLVLLNCPNTNDYEVQLQEILEVCKDLKDQT